MQSNGNIAYRLRRGLVARLLDRRVPLREAANDNASHFGASEHGEAMLEAALRHFARHGLGAARAARHEAQQAFFAGDTATYRHWLGICRLLDRRMAKLAQQRLEQDGTALPPRKQPHA